MLRVLHLLTVSEEEYSRDLELLRPCLSRFGVELEFVLLPEYFRFFSERVSSLRRLARVFRGFSPQIFHIYSMQSYPYLFFFPRRPFVFSCSYRELCFGGGGLWNFIRTFLAQFLAFHVSHLIVSSYQARSCLWFARSRRKAFMIPTPVNGNFFYPMEKGDCQRKLGLSGDFKYILFPHSEANSSGYSLLEEALLRLRGRISAPVEVIRTFGRDESDLPFYMNAVDCVVWCGDFWASTRVLKQALACNVPIVAMGDGEVRELLEDVLDCFLSRWDPDDLSNKIFRVLRRNSYSDGRKKIHLWDPEKIAIGLARIYHRILKKPFVGE
ncbi:MAG: hypothetical protein D6805_09390 [Planctomycetota bacterium]|nr:MAG: hypothetical protein D6805_09390 [Planctomycetota bacterium]